MLVRNATATPGPCMAHEPRQTPGRRVWWRAAAVCCARARRGCVSAANCCPPLACTLCYTSGGQRMDGPRKERPQWRQAGRTSAGAQRALAGHLHRLRRRLYVLHQVKAAGAHPHRAAQHDAGSRGGEGVDVAVQGGRHQEGGRRLKRDLQEGGGAGLDADAVACTIAALRWRGGRRRGSVWEASGGEAQRGLPGRLPGFREVAAIVPCGPAAGSAAPERQQCRGRALCAPTCTACQVLCRATR